MRALWLFAAFGILLGGLSSARAASFPGAAGLVGAAPSLSEPAFFGISIFGRRGYGRRHRTRRAYRNRRPRGGQVVSRTPAESFGSPALAGPARSRGDRSGWVDPPPRAP